MKRVILPKHISLLFVLAVATLLAPMSLAENSCGSNGSSAETKQLQGEIESVTPTNFAIKTRVRARKAGRLTAIVVHYNPETVQMTVDGVAVQTIDVRQTGKYAVVTGTIVNAVLEAMSITITTNPPQQHHKGQKSN